MPSRAPRFLALLLLALLAGGCAGRRAPDNGPVDRNVITQAELQQTEARDAYEAVERLRPLWLRSRGERSPGALSTSILVYLNDAQLGGLSSLRGLSLAGVRAIRYLDGPSAAARLGGIGAGHVEGAIVVETDGR